MAISFCWRPGHLGPLAGWPSLQRALPLLALGLSGTALALQVKYLVPAAQASAMNAGALNELKEELQRTQALLLSMEARLAAREAAAEELAAPRV
jgi:hypothetical protein